MRSVSVRAVLVLAACGMLAPSDLRVVSRRPLLAAFGLDHVALVRLLDSSRVTSAELSFLASHAPRRVERGREFLAHPSGAGWMCFPEAASEVVRFPIIAGATLSEFRLLLDPVSPEWAALSWFRLEFDAARSSDVWAFPERSPADFEDAFHALAALDREGWEVFDRLVADSPPDRALESWPRDVTRLAELSCLALTS